MEFSTLTSSVEVVRRRLLASLAPSLHGSVGNNVVYLSFTAQIARPRLATYLSIIIVEQSVVIIVLITACYFD